MGIFGLGRGLLLTLAVLFGLALLKKLIIVFGVVFAVIKFGIIIAFVVLMISILVAMCRDRAAAKKPYPAP